MDITSDTHSQHISRQFNHELEELKTHLMAMGGLVEKQVQDAVSSLLDADSALASRVVDNDRAVNDMQVKIDDECTRVLARRQPAASDLRLVLAVIRAASDLERIGDEVVSYRLVGDWRLYAEVLAQPDAHISYVAKPLNVHRRHATSVTHSMDHMAHLQEIVAMHSYFQANFDLPEAVSRNMQAYISELEAQFGLSSAA